MTYPYTWESTPGSFIYYLHLLTCSNGTYRSLGHRYNLCCERSACIFLDPRPVHLTKEVKWEEPAYRHFAEAKLNDHRPVCTTRDLVYQDGGKPETL